MSSTERPRSGVASLCRFFSCGSSRAFSFSPDFEPPLASSKLWYWTELRRPPRRTGCHVSVASDFARIATRPTSLGERLSDEKRKPWAPWVPSSLPTSGRGWSATPSTRTLSPSVTRTCILMRRRLRIEDPAADLLGADLVDKSAHLRAFAGDGALSRPFAPDGQAAVASVPGLSTGDRTNGKGIPARDLPQAVPALGKSILAPELRAEGSSGILIGRQAAARPSNRAISRPTSISSRVTTGPPSATGAMRSGTPVSLTRFSAARFSGS